MGSPPHNAIRRVRSAPDGSFAVLNRRSVGDRCPWMAFNANSRRIPETWWSEATTAGWRETEIEERCLPNLSLQHRPNPTRRSTPPEPTPASPSSASANLEPVEQVVATVTLPAPRVFTPGDACPKDLDSVAGTTTRRLWHHSEWRDDSSNPSDDAEDLMKISWSELLAMEGTLVELSIPGFLAAAMPTRQTQS